MHNVFVYGSLKKGYWNNVLIENSKFLGNGIIRGFDMLSFGAFPAIIPNGDGIVHGEVYRVNDAELNSMDRLESNGSFYNRELITVEGVDGVEEAWVYILLPSERMQSLTQEGVLREAGQCTWKGRV